jgi:hypothetical protein
MRYSRYDHRFKEKAIRCQSLTAKSSNVGIRRLPLLPVPNFLTRSSRCSSRVSRPESVIYTQLWITTSVVYLKTVILALMTELDQAYQLLSSLWWASVLECMTLEPRPTQSRYGCLELRTTDTCQDDPRSVQPGLHRKPSACLDVYTDSVKVSISGGYLRSISFRRPQRNDPGALGKMFHYL